ncbi:MAG TPA: hypothetical protein VII73_14455 [Caulobacteraceae bacterium]
MAHWFDALCKGLVGEPSLSRRGAIGAAFAGTVASSWVGRAVAAATGSDGNLAPARSTVGTCTRQSSKGSTLHDFEVDTGSYSLHHRLSATADGGAASQVTAADAGRILYHLEAKSTKAGAASATITFGRDGAQNASITTEDGRTFKGLLGTRAFTVAGRPKSLADFHFTDGQPAPIFNAPADLASFDAAVRPRLEAMLADCAPAGPAQRLIHARHPRPDTSYLRAGANQDGYTYVPGETYQGVGCDNCKNSCETIYQDALPSLFDAFGCPVCAVAQAAAALVVYGVCIGICNLPGGGCCPVSCGGAFVCCFDGDTCYENGICCTGPSIVCNNACCTPGVTKCASDGSCGCGDYTQCGDFCCQPGDRCCGDTVCCPKGSKCCGKTCVPDAVTCCNGQGCADGETCLDGPKGKTCCIGPLNAAGDCCGLNYQCGSTCCDASAAVCVSGRCCPQGQVCGKVCCPSGASCKDASTGTCGGKCPPGIASCNGVCCPASADKMGQIVCCTPQQQDRAPFNNSAYGCHHASACAAPLK